MPGRLSTDRPIGRGAYFIAGLLLFVLKHNLDRLLASYFGHPFELFSYLAPVGHALTFRTIAGDEKFLLALAALSVPFVALGIWLTLRRLHTLYLPGWLVALFFIPIINVLLFATLSLIPSRANVNRGDQRPPALERFIPDTVFGSAAVSLLFTVPVGLAFVALAVTALGRYGTGLFLAIPFSVGFGAALVFGYHQSRSLVSCLAVALSANLILGGLIFAAAFEGVLCLIMALPLTMLFGMIGGIAGYALQSIPRRRVEASAMAIVLLLFTPSVVTLEKLLNPESPVLSVVSSIEINAPPERVWTNVISFSELPPPTEALFRAGIAYPIRAHIDGTGPGAVRRCEFSTGAFVEPIQVWDEPRLLKFSVAANPQPMQEWTPYRHVEPRHLDGYLVSKQGQFRLTPLPGGRTLLEGTTWYQHHLLPASYWRVWSDAIIHRIHLRVLRHIKNLSES